MFISILLMKQPSIQITAIMLQELLNSVVAKTTDRYYIFINYSLFYEIKCRSFETYLLSEFCYYVMKGKKTFYIKEKIFKYCFYISVKFL